MIILRRAEERHHERGRSEERWLTFSAGGRATLADGFGRLETLDEARLFPGGVLARHPPHDAEIVTFVREGALAFEDSTGFAGLLQAGEIQRVTVGRGSRHRETNPSSTAPTRLLQIWLRPAQADLEPSHRQRRFSAAERRGRLCVVVSPDGRRESLTVHQDTLVYTALLDPGRHVVHELSSGRRAWLHMVVGEARFGELVLSAGDGVGVTGEPSISLTAQRRTELLLVDLREEAGGSPGNRPSSELGAEQAASSPR